MYVLPVILFLFLCVIAGSAKGTTEQVILVVHQVDLIFETGVDKKMFYVGHLLFSLERIELEQADIE